MMSNSVVFGPDPHKPQRVSSTVSGAPPTRGSQQPALSADGRVVAFASDADDLVVGDANHLADVFVHDRDTRQTELASVSTGGRQGNEVSGFARLSADGRLVAFESRASNLVDGDPPHAREVFIHDRATGQTECASVASDGTPANNASSSPSISADARLVAFASVADNLVPGDTNRHSDVFVRDRSTGQTTRVSVAPGGVEANGSSEHPALSADGRFVAFTSQADNLVADDRNRNTDVFVRDLQTGEVACVSLSMNGGTADLGSGHPCLSADGRFVAFQSFATDIVPAVAPPPTTGLKESHVYVHDRQTHRTVRVDPDQFAGEQMADAYFPELSADGSYLVYQATARRMSHDDDPHHSQVFVADLQRGGIDRVSGPDPNTQGRSGNSHAPAISADGSVIAFASEARNLVEGEQPKAASIYVVSNPLPRARGERAEEALRREQEAEPREAPHIDHGDGYVIIDGVRVPVRS